VARPPKSKEKAYHKKSTIRLIRKKKRFWKISKNKPGKKWQKKYNAVSLKLKAAIFAEAKENEAHILNSGNLGLFYKHVNSRKSHKSGIAPVKNQLGKIMLNL